MMLDAHESVVPRDAMAKALIWMNNLARELPRAEPAGRRPDNIATGAVAKIELGPEAGTDPVVGDQPPGAVSEQIVRFGNEKSLFGIVSFPAAGTAVGQDRSALLLVNSGAVEHSGPYRAYVSIARYFAARGYIVLRMDIAGIGDSDPPQGEKDNVVYAGHALSSVEAALRFLRDEYDLTGLWAGGICSGAYHSFKAAAAELPLTGVVLINPLTFFWKEGMSLKYPEFRVAADVARYKTNVFSFSKWIKLLSGRVNLWELGQVLFRVVREAAVNPLRDVVRWVGIPLNEDLPTELLKASSSGVDLQFVFSSTDPGLDLLRRKGGRIARRLIGQGKVEIQLINGADHTFSYLAHRKELIQACARALENGKPGGAGIVRRA
jgi:dienelactone hydrolase